MSLLMDALKKAEQEKKEAAEKRKLQDDTGFHLHESAADSTAPQGIEDLSASPETSQAEDSPQVNRPLQDLSLEPMGAQQAESSTETADDNYEQSSPEIEMEEEEITPEQVDRTQALEQSLELSGPQEQLDKTSKNEQHAGPPAEEADLDQTFHGVDLEKTYSSELYEDTVQGEAFKQEDLRQSYDETLPGVPAAQLAKDIGTQDQPTPVAAQTVFTATNTIAKPASALKWVLISISVIAVCLVVIYFYSVTPINRDIPSPIVARGVETIISSAGVNNALPPPVTSQPAELAELPETGTAAGAGTKVGSVVPQDEEIESETVAENTQGETPESEPGPPETTMNDQDETGSSGTLSEVIEPPSSMISISRSRVTNEGNEVIQEAFLAYRSGDYSLAESRYRDAIRQYPDNRDVLLGLAAIESHKGNMPAAMDIYLRLLRRNPLDNIARAAVLGFQPDNNSTRSISAIKNMIYDSPEQPLLYFTLGKLYASRANWSEAQQAFFDAYRLDTSNPDFALNLAVSLDRLGQTQTALDYYNVALELSRATPAGFDPAMIRERINTLTKVN